MGILSNFLEKDIRTKFGFVSKNEYQASSLSFSTTNDVGVLLEERAVESGKGKASPRANLKQSNLENQQTQVQRTEVQSLESFARPEISPSSPAAQDPTPSNGLGQVEKGTSRQEASPTLLGQVSTASAEGVLENKLSSLSEVDKSTESETLEGRTSGLGNTSRAPLFTKKEPSVEFGQVQKDSPVNDLENSASRLGDTNKAVQENLLESSASRLGETNKTVQENALENSASKLGETSKNGSSVNLENKTTRLQPSDKPSIASSRDSSKSDLGAVNLPVGGDGMESRTSNLGGTQETKPEQDLQNRPSTLQNTSQPPTLSLSLGERTVSSLGNNGKEPERIPPIPLSVRQKDTGQGERGSSIPGQGANRASIPSSLSQLGASRLGTNGASKTGLGANRPSPLAPPAQAQKTVLGFGGLAPRKFIPPPPVPEFGKYGGAVQTAGPSLLPPDFADYIVDMEDYVVATYVRNEIVPPSEL